MTTEDALNSWDQGESVWSIEMGGLGPGYEQAIQVFAFELIRKLLGSDLPNDNDDLNKLFNDACDGIHEKMNYGMSGAQVGAAKQIAYKALSMGWDEMIESIPQDRKIQVSNNWPQALATN